VSEEVNFDSVTVRSDKEDGDGAVAVTGWDRAEVDGDNGGDGEGKSEQDEDGEERRGGKV
jgi:hypothetical protein